MAVFQESFVSQVKTLKEGFSIEVEGTPQFKLNINGQVADLMVNLGECLFRFGRENSRMWKYSRFPGRNHEDCLMHAQLTVETGVAVFGVKGHSPVHGVLQIPDMILFDYMHQVLEGEYTR